MISRRTFLKASLAAVGFVRRASDALANASPSGTAVDFDVPAGACDCHVHIFGDPQRFPFSPARTYTPAPASVRELRALHQALHLNRVVVVQPSVYGTDNSCLLDALRQLGARARGIAVIDAATPGAALDELERAGIRGVHLSLTQGGVADPSAARRRFQSGIERIKGRNWHLQIYTHPATVETIHDQVLASPVPVVFNHFSGAIAARGLSQPGFGALVNLVSAGKAYVKISAAADQVSIQAPDYPDVAPFARALVAANPRRILWGTNWPHPNSANPRSRTDPSPPLPTDDARVLNLLAEWVPDAPTRQAILVENPKRLYGF